MIYALLCAVIAGLLLKISALKKGIRDIAEQFGDRMENDTNNVIYVRSADRDLRRLAGCLNDKLRQLRSEHHRFTQGDRELKEAVTNISHDIRTPLTAICGYLDILRKKELPQDVERCLGIIADRTDAIRTLTDEMLGYSVAVSEKQEPELSDVILNDVLAETVSAFYGVLTEQGIEPEISICGEEVHRSLDRNALARVYSNIISNAVKYSDGDLKISLSADGAVSFFNHAAALDKVDAGKLFQRFYTVENAGRSTGLGLTIARTLTEQMGGSVDASCDEGIMKVTVNF